MGLFIVHEIKKVMGIHNIMQCNLESRQVWMWNREFYLDLITESNEFFLLPFDDMT